MANKASNNAHGRDKRGNITLSEQESYWHVHQGHDRHPVVGPKHQHSHITPSALGKPPERQAQQVGTVVPEEGRKAVYPARALLLEHRSDLRVSPRGGPCSMRSSGCQRSTVTWRRTPGTEPLSRGPRGPAPARCERPCVMAVEQGRVDGQRKLVEAELGRGRKGGAGDGEAKSSLGGAQAPASTRSSVR
eukprot:3940895-Rhodomonas_salina.7